MPRHDDINPKEVKLWTREILQWMARGTKGKEEYTVEEVANKFKLTRKEAFRRLNRLRSWGVVKIFKRIRPKTYIVTAWGFKYLHDKKERGERDSGVPSQPESN